MISQSENNTLAAVFLWVQNRITQLGVAYNTLTTRLFPIADPTVPTGYLGYSAPLKPFVYDSGISGALIINSVSGGGYSEPLTRDSGLYFDYENARVLVPKTLGQNLVLSGTASFSEFGFYLPNEDEAQILTQAKQFINPRFMSTLGTSGVQPNTITTPAIFINPIHTENMPFAFGGLIETHSTYTFTVIAESNYQLNAVFSILRDAKYQYIPSLNTVQDPLNQWGDFKGAPTGYNYQQFMQIWGQPGNLIYISDVRTAKVSDRLKTNPQQFIGLVDMELVFVRQAPISSTVFT